MRRNFKFLMQVFVCLFTVNTVFGQPVLANQTQNLPGTEGSTSSSHARELAVATLPDMLANAKQLLRAKGFDRSTVSLGAFDVDAAQLHVVGLDKELFLTKGGEYLLTSDRGARLRLHIVRPNGVNTAVKVSDAVTGRSLFPLMVRYPIERDGNVEPAFYVSAHPALVSPELAAAGRTYVSTMLDEAAEGVAQDGVQIPADILNVAAHLVIVEHTDHRRFLNDNRATIYPEVLSLYALNRGDTFRYSVSSAGAGGMIQMIPRTYQAIREHHPNVALDADFVSGMQNHANALKAMLLYINDTWNYLKQTTEVQQALQSGTATKTELLAAGYNSNPYKLPSYLSNGGSGWRSLIPAETQMYLAIYQSVDANVDFASVNSAAIDVTSGSLPAVARVATAAFVASVGSMLN